MSRPQYFSTIEINGAHIPTTPNLSHGGEGVTFKSKNVSIEIEFASSIIPTIEYVSIADNKITNINQLFITIIDFGGSIIGTFNSPVNNTVVTGFPDTPLPKRSTLLISFLTRDQAPPRNVTLSIIACYSSPSSTTQSKLDRNYEKCRINLFITVINQMQFNIATQHHNP